MAAALGTWSAISVTKPRRIEGHTSNVEVPIFYSQYIKGTIGETTEANDTYIIPHKFNQIHFINSMPLAADVAPTLLYGDGTTIGVWFADAATVTGPTQITTAAAAGAKTVVLTSGTAIDDVYNQCWLDIRYSDGTVQTTKITDYTGSTAVATIVDGLAQDIAATGTYYTVRGTIMTVNTAAATPTVAFEVIGSFNT